MIERQQHSFFLSNSHRGQGQDWFGVEHVWCWHDIPSMSCRVNEMRMVGVSVRG